MINLTRENALDYLTNNVFPILLSAMEEMLLEADRRSVIKMNKSSFNGLDYLAEILWNRNPRYPNRSCTWLNVFNIPQFKLWLKSHPRPIYPKSWLWSREDAAIRIQRYVRGWLIRKRTDVQEMRQFWKVMRAEKMNVSTSRFEIMCPIKWNIQD